MYSVQQDFRTEQDKARHKCIEERLKLEHQQLQCTACDRWFRSKGGLAAHKCNERNLHNPTEHLHITVVENRLHSSVCERSLK